MRKSGYLLNLPILIALILSARSARDLITISDSLSGQNLPNVSIIVEGTTIGTATDRNAGRTVRDERFVGFIFYCANYALDSLLIGHSAKS
jgi:hypothetical protein